MGQILSFVKDIFQQKGMLLALASNDLRAKFAASFLGVIWAFIQPLVTILVFWFVFQLGFRNPPVDDVPFILWFIPAYLVWTFFTEGLLAASNCLMEYSYLVKKVNFRVSIIPLVKVLSSLFVSGILGPFQCLLFPSVVLPFVRAGAVDGARLAFVCHRPFCQGYGEYCQRFYSDRLLADTYFLVAGYDVADD